MRSTNRQDIPSSSGELVVVATPIGNLSDLSPRAKAALTEAEVVLCEDTRQTGKLLELVGVAKPHSALARVDAHASPAKLQAIVERIEAGARMALVTDAGTPSISDPGAALVALAREAGIRVTPVPGPSALAAFLSASGFTEASFVFRGFFPRKDGDRARELEQAQASEVSRLFVWFESPNRIVSSLAALSEKCAECQVVAAKELTKLHERFFSGKAGEVAEWVREEVEREGERGEWCFGARFPEKAHEFADWEKILSCLIDCGVSPSEASRRVSQQFGAPKREAYQRAIAISSKKNQEGY